MSQSSGQNVDVLIIGSGVVGALMAYACASRGLSVCVMEKGPDYPFPFTIPFNEYTHSNRYVRDFSATPTDDAPRDLKGHTRSGDYAGFIDVERYFREGGSATAWAAIALRLPPTDFRLATLYGYGQDWPVSYDDLEPYYCRAEDELGVSGSDKDNPFASPRSKDYPLPPFALSRDDLLLADKLKAQGIVLHTTPQARTRLPHRGRPQCENFGACGVCPLGAKYSPNAHLYQAIATGRCALMTNTSVRRVVVGENQRPVVAYRRNDAREDSEMSARRVVIACGAVESARLLLLSKSGAHPDGLGNAGGQVGRNFTLHHIWYGHLYYDKPHFTGNVGPFTGQSHQFLNPTTRGKHGGVKVEFSSNTSWGRDIATENHESPEAIVEALRKKMHFRPIALHAESVASPDKYICLSEKLDRFGDPFAHVAYKSAGFDYETYQFSCDVFNRFKEATQASDGWLNGVNAFAAVGHHMGTCRMGLSPQNSVVDPFCRVHGAPSVYIVGAGNFLGSCGPVNPTLTIAALALRAADHLWDSWATA